MHVHCIRGYPWISVNRSVNVHRCPRIWPNIHGWMFLHAQHIDGHPGLFEGHHWQWLSILLTHIFSSSSSLSLTMSVFIILQQNKNFWEQIQLEATAKTHGSLLKFSTNYPGEAPQILILGASWKLLGHRGSEIPKMSPRELPENHLAAKPLKCSKWFSRNILKAIWQPKSRNTSN